MDRKQTILNYCCKDDEEKALLEPVVEDMLYLETQLRELKKLPHYRVNPNNPEQQKTTPAARLYRENLNSYIMIVKMLEKKTDDTDSDSPLREWLKTYGKC